MLRDACEFVFRSMLLLSAAFPLFLPEHGHAVHALLPQQSSMLLGTPASRHSSSDRRSRILVAGNSLEDDANWDDSPFDEEEASRAILDGQGDFFTFRFYPMRGGGVDGAHNASSKPANRIVAMMSPTLVLRSLREGCAQRIAADPAFLSKSLLEIVLAASTQYAAEVGRRGRERMLPEIDFVFAGILTAVCGKYYSMWRVARTVDASNDSADHAAGVKNEDAGGDSDGGDDDSKATTNWKERVPTNAFQPTLLDGRTAPALSSRFLAFLLPMPALFRAGVVASTIGYGLTALLVRIRTILAPGYAVATKPVSVPLAAIYTGAFMALVSNVRYQLLQGVVEPCLIDGAFDRMESLLGGKNATAKKLPRRLRIVRSVKKLVIALVRWWNGLLGSWLAIGGMRACGLQKLKY